MSDPTDWVDTEDPGLPGQIPHPKSRDEAIHNAQIEANHEGVFAVEGKWSFADDNDFPWVTMAAHPVKVSPAQERSPA